MMSDLNFFEFIKFEDSSDSGSEVSDISSVPVPEIVIDELIDFSSDWSDYSGDSADSGIFNFDNLNHADSHINGVDISDSKKLSEYSSDSSDSSGSSDSSDSSDSSGSSDSSDSSSGESEASSDSEMQVDNSHSSKEDSTNSNFNESDPYGRMKLPIYSGRSNFINEMKEHDTLILVGETGSGKTTQIPQYIYEEGLHLGKKIAVTQPRRVAAITIAERVAMEHGCDLGETVGYSVRFDDTTSSYTKIKYMTDGMLVWEAMKNPNLLAYNFIILDEAHERTINTDVLFGIVKQAQIRRKLKKNRTHLKVIIMSATMEVEHFKDFFENSKVVYVKGRLYPLDIYFSDKRSEDKCHSTLMTITQLHSKLKADCHILAFLTGQDEIESGVAFLKKMEFEDPMVVYPLYASLSQDLQLKALMKPEPGTRKVILATNIAETSITIPGIKVVIDSTRVKSSFSFGFINSLKTVPISKAQAFQRAGRAGRECNGLVYRICTAEEFQELDEFSVPEIQRSNVSGVILHLLKIGINNPLSFDWLDPPNRSSLDHGIKELYRLNAITTRTEPLTLTELGNKMANIPLEPLLSRALIFSAKYLVYEPVATIIGVLSSDGIFSKCNDKIIAQRKRFWASEGDLLTYLNIAREFKKSKQKVLWCKSNGLNFRSLDFAIKIRQHLVEIGMMMGIIQANAYLQGDEMKYNVRKCFFEAMSMNCARQVKGNQYKYKPPGEPSIIVKIHPASVLFYSQPPVVLFTEFINVRKDINFIRNLTIIEGRWFEESK